LVFSFETNQILRASSNRLMLVDVACDDEEFGPAGTPGLLRAGNRFGRPGQFSELVYPEISLPGEYPGSFGAIPSANLV
jgi:hypothetical protein